MPFAYVPGDNDIESVDRNGTKNLIDAAKKTGVKRFIYTSFSKNIDADFPLRNAKRDVEEYLKNSELTYTILRPGYFMEVWLSEAVGFDAANGKVQVCGDGQNPISYISYKDVARFAVKSLENPMTENAILELGGPQPLSQLEVIKIYESQSDRKFEVKHVPLEALENQMNTADDPMQKSFSGLMVCLAQGDSILMKEKEKQFGVELTTVKQFAGKTMEKTSSRTV
jgi:uncharacterized protein YbjT (DUF2867 family)